ncbi:MAG: hypothetical protein ABIH25_05670 [Candidatus Woesearchaeota archaeon]
MGAKRVVKGIIFILGFFVFIWIFWILSFFLFGSYGGIQTIISTLILSLIVLIALVNIWRKGFKKIKPKSILVYIFVSLSIVLLITSISAFSQIKEKDEELDDYRFYYSALTCFDGDQLMYLPKYTEYGRKWLDYNSHKEVSFKMTADYSISRHTCEEEFERQGYMVEDPYDNLEYPFKIGSLKNFACEIIWVNKLGLDGGLEYGCKCEYIADDSDPST